MKQTIANRSAELKSITPIHARQEESDKISDAIAEFQANGGVITKVPAGAFRFKSDLEKGNDTRKRRKAGVKCRGDNK